MRRHSLPANILSGFIGLLSGTIITGTLWYLTATTLVVETDGRIESQRGKVDKAVVLTDRESAVEIESERSQALHQNAPRTQKTSNGVQEQFTEKVAAQFVSEDNKNVSMNSKGGCSTSQQGTTAFDQKPSPTKDVAQPELLTIVINKNAPTTSYDDNLASQYPDPSPEDYRTLQRLQAKLYDPVFVQSFIWEDFISSNDYTSLHPLHAIEIADQITRLINSRTIPHPGGVAIVSDGTD